MEDLVQLPRADRQHQGLDLGYATRGGHVSPSLERSNARPMPLPLRRTSSSRVVLRTLQSSDPLAPHGNQGEEPNNNRSAWRRTDVVSVVCLTTFAALLRAPQLGPVALWHDDAWVAVLHRVGYADVLTIGLTAPGFGFFMKLWFDLVGFNEITAQLPAFIAGAAAPALAYGVLRKRCRQPIALVSGLILVLAPAHIEYSGRLKHYTFEVVLALLVLAISLSTLDDPRSRRNWALFAGATTAAIFASFLLVLLALAAAFACLVAAAQVSRRTLLRALPWAAVPVGFAAILYASVISKRMTDALADFWSSNYIQLDTGPRVALESTLGRFHEVLEGFSTTSPWITAPLVLLALAALLARRPLQFVVTGGPLLAALVLAAGHRAPLGGGRTDLYLLAPILVGTALGLNELLDKIAASQRPRPALVRSTNSLGIMAAAVVLLFGVLRYDVPRYPQMETRPLIDLMDEMKQPEDAVLIFYPSRFAYVIYSDAEIKIWPSKKIAQYDLSIKEPGVFLAFDAARAAAYGDRVWFLASSLHRPGLPGFKVRLEREFGLEQVQQWDEPGAELILYETRSDL